MSQRESTSYSQNRVWETSGVSLSTLNIVVGEAMPDEPQEEPSQSRAASRSAVEFLRAFDVEDSVCALSQT